MAKHRKITIVVALTDDLIEKSQDVFRSVTKNGRQLRKCVMIIGKTEQSSHLKWSKLLQDWEVASLPLERLASYKANWPKNRKFYACAEGGEFLDHFQFDSDEVIIKLDADFVMQRQMSADEWISFETLQHGVVMSNYHSYPPTTLREEYWKLLPEVGYDKAQDTFPGEWNSINMFCAGFVACTAVTYRRISKSYLYHHRKITQTFGHHAAGQWLMNWIVGRNFNFQPQPPSLHNASWYIDTPCYEHAQQLYYQDSPVLFNHTKFMKEYAY